MAVETDAWPNESEDMNARNIALFEYVQVLFFVLDLWDGCTAICSTLNTGRPKIRIKI
jgi:hypothetical protein